MAKKQMSFRLDQDTVSEVSSIIQKLDPKKRSLTELIEDHLDEICANYDAAYDNSSYYSDVEIHKSKAWLWRLFL